jgi:hypothetical protein
MKIIKAGILDDTDLINDAAKPAAELYAPMRATWQPKMDGTDDKQGMS